MKSTESGQNHDKKTHRPAFARGPLIIPFVNRQVDYWLKQVGSDFLQDGRIHVFLAGTGAPMGATDRAKASTVIIAANQLIIVDIGPGAWKNIESTRLPVEDLSAILLTHYHSDHIGDLGEAAIQSWIKGRNVPLELYGPAGVEEISAGFNTAYRLDRMYRNTHHGEQHMPMQAGLLNPSTISFSALDEAVTVLEKNGLRITAFLVDHAPVDPAIGYRFDYNGRSVVISGDTRKHANVLRYANGADMLIHEVVAQYLADLGIKRMHKRGYSRFAVMADESRDYHTSPREATEIAQKAGVKKLVFTHIVPPLRSIIPNYLMRLIFFGGWSTGFDGPVLFGKDGMWLHV